MYKGVMGLPWGLCMALVGIGKAGRLKALLLPRLPLTHSSTHRALHIKPPGVLHSLSV